MPFTPEYIIPAQPRVEQGKATILNTNPAGDVLLYGNRNNVIIRNIKDSKINDIYSEHPKQVSTAAYSPSGFYIASADITGKVRIWDTVNKEHILKAEYSPIGKDINDLSWSADSTKICVGGNGFETFAAVFNMDTGTTVGTVMGISRQVNSITYRPARPFRIVTGTDDGFVTVSEGPPFKFKSSVQNHNNFVQSVRYAPDGSLFLSAGSDCKIFVYDGNSGDTVKELGSPAHKGGVYAVSFHKSSQAFVSASGDKSVKLWRRKSPDGLSFDCVSQFTFDNVKSNLLLGCLWAGDTIAALTLDAKLHLFSDADGAITELKPPARAIIGHSNIITCAYYSTACQRLYTGGVDCACYAWNLTTCLAEAAMTSSSRDHPVHSAQLQSLVVVEDGDKGCNLVSVGVDDRCIMSSITKDGKMECISSAKLPSQPIGLVQLNNPRILAVACGKHLVIVELGPSSVKIVVEQAIDFGACSITFSAKVGVILVCTEDSKLKAFRVVDKTITTVQVEDASAKSHALITFSPVSNELATADDTRTINIYAATLSLDSSKLTLNKTSSDWWQSQTARISALSWSPNGKQVASASLDRSISVWTLEKPKDKLMLKIAHPMSHSVAVCWTSNDRLASAAHDGSIRVWKLT